MQTARLPLHITPLMHQHSISLFLTYTLSVCVWNIFLPVTEEDGLDDFVVDDLADVVGGGDDDYDVARDKKILTSIAVQDAFQPGATPSQGGLVDKDIRFLAYNSIGNITSTEEKTINAVTGEESDEADKIHIVQMNYTDTTKHKATKFRDYYGFKMAALGAHGAVFASPRGWDKKEKKELPSTIFFRPSDSWDTKANSEWILHFPLGSGAAGAHKEEIVAVALGDTFVAVATSKQYVRFMSHTGVQLFVLSVPGPIVCLVGQASQLAVTFHSGVPLPGHQNLGGIVFDVQKRKETYRGPVSISPRSSLTWMGFSDIGTVLSMDSYGVLRALARNWGAEWTPVMETHSLRGSPGVGALDSHWPVSVLGETLMCLLLPDGKKFPTAGKKSAQSLQSVVLQLPFLALEQPVAQHEEQHARHALMKHKWLEAGDDGRGLGTVSKYYSSAEEVEQDKLVLALFQRAIKSDFLARALDLATMLYKKKSLEVATQMANHEQKKALVGRLNLLMQVKFIQAEERARVAKLSNQAEEEGIISFLDLDAAAASGGIGVNSSIKKRGKLIRPGGGVSFDEAEVTNRRMADEDDGEAEYEIGSQPKGILKQSQSNVNANPFSSGALSQRSTVQSANVKPKNANTQSPKKK
jgi:chromosome transmission fidelity protein 4